MAMFGRHLQKLRKARGRSLRKVARGIEKTPGYLSRIERGEVPPPSDEVIIALAEQLGEDPDVLLVMAGRAPEGLLEIIRENPFEFARLIRRLKGAPGKVVEQVARKVKDGNW